MSWIPSAQGIAVICGMAVIAGGVLLVAGLRRSPPRLSDALGALDARPAPRAAAVPQVTSERAGLWLARHTPLPLLDSQVRQLELSNKSVPEFFADKLVMMILGAMVPGVLGAVFGWLLGWSLPVPVIVALLGAIVGYFVPDLLLQRSGDQARSNASEALFMFFDLVTLERLANQSATQALQSSAQVSEHPLFVSLRTSLLRARLEQQPPYAELRRLAERLRMPQLSDIADVLQLDEQGAAVSGALRARVRELRQTHLSQARAQAHKASESLTVWMSIPAMILGLVFLAPPIFRLLS